MRRSVVVGDYACGVPRPRPRPGTDRHARGVRAAFAVRLGQAGRPHLPQTHQPDRRRAVPVRRASTARPRPGQPVRRGGHHPGSTLILALAAVHAARVVQIGTLMLDDVDIGNRRMTIAGRVRPLDERPLRRSLGRICPSRPERHRKVRAVVADAVRKTSTGRGPGSRRSRAEAAPAVAG